MDQRSVTGTVLLLTRYLLPKLQYIDVINERGEYRNLARIAELLGRTLWVGCISLMSVRR